MRTSTRPTLRIANAGPRVAVSLTALVLIAVPAGAYNANFFPGDAFFHFRLDAPTAARLGEAPSPVFQYERPDPNTIVFCGYAGYAQLRHDRIPLRLRNGLLEVFARLRAAHERKPPDDGTVSDDDEREPFALHVFAYNEQFDLTRFRVALKYNESWVEDAAAFGHDRSRAYYAQFARDNALTLEEWRDAAIVAPLAVESKPKNRPSSESPDIVRASRGIKFIVLESGDFGAYARRAAGLALWEVTSRAARRLVSDGRRWIDPTAAESQDR